MPGRTDEALAIRTDWLPYAERLSQRDLAEIDLVVIHATELPDLATARRYGEQIHYPGSRSGNSGHFYIDRDGRIEQWVPLDRVAHHVVGFNQRSIGIELVNLGRYPDWLDSRHQTWQEPITEAQFQALSAVLRQLKVQLPSLAEMIGHDDLDRRLVPASNDPATSVRRKLDPGPDFPWERLAEASGLARAGWAQGR